MSVTATSSIDGQRIVGDLWPIAVEVFDSNGWPTIATVPTVTVTLPDNSTADVTVEAAGRCFRALYELTAPGRHLAEVAATGLGRADFSIQAVDPTPAGRMPQLADATSYLGQTSWSSDDVQEALDAETAAQAALCVIPAYYPADMRNALLRRVWRNLSMRNQPFLTVPGGEDGTVSVGPSQDAEVRRLEAPHRRLLVA